MEFKQFSESHEKITVPPPELGAPDFPLHACIFMGISDPEQKLLHLVKYTHTHTHTHTQLFILYIRVTEFAFVWF